MRVEELRERGSVGGGASVHLLARERGDCFGHGGVSAAAVHGTGSRVVVLVLRADDDGPVRLATANGAAVDAGADAVGVGVEPLGVGLAGAPYLAAMPGAYGSCWMRTPSRRYSGASAVDMATWRFDDARRRGGARAGQAGERHAPTEVIAEERRTTSEGVTIRAETTAGIGGARGSASKARRIRRRGARRARDEKVRSWHVSTTLARHRVRLGLHTSTRAFRIV